MKNGQASAFNPNQPTLTSQINPVGDRLRGAVARVEKTRKAVFHREKLGSRSCRHEFA